MSLLVKPHQLLSVVNAAISRGLHFNRRLPTFYAGHWLWPARASWRSLVSRYEPAVARGANEGWFSLLADKIVGHCGSVYAFEPSPDVFALLSSNVSARQSIRAVQCGCGGVDAMVEFAAQGTSSSGSFVESVTKINESFLPDTPISCVPVQLKRIDSLVSELAAPPHLIKIDVEGFELEVLKGATELLSGAAPKLIIEIHPPQLGLSGGSEPLLFELLREHGYEWRTIDRNKNSLYTIFAEPVTSTLSSATRTPTDQRR